MRLFVALNFPEEVRRNAWAAAEPLRSAGLPVRWVPEDAIHLTLKFLGEVDPGRVPAITGALDAAARATRPFMVRLSGFGVFPSLERPNIIWVGCEGVPPLEFLQHDVESKLDHLGYPVEGRPFRPHLTLGRVKKDARRGAFEQLEALLGRPVFEAESFIQSVDLVHSTPGSQGSRYRVVHAAALSDTA